jgi:protein gp37
VGSTQIEWTDYTWNPIRARRRDNQKSIGWFCVHESDGCRFCYSEVINRRLGTSIDYKAQNREQVEIVLDDKMLTAPLRWKKPRRIFVCSMTDLFGEFVPDEFIDRMFAVMALTPQHTFQVLTKRPERMKGYCLTPSLRRRLHDRARDVPQLLQGRMFARRQTDLEINMEISGDNEIPWPLPNVWLGTSCEDQKTADARIPHLLATPAAVRFLSCEPVLGPVDIGRPIRDCTLAGTLYGDGKQRPIEWVIVGGESGQHARPMHPDWARSLRDQCAAAGVAFHFKQWGEWHPNDHAIIGDTGHTKLGKSRSGRILDGRTHDEFPVAA